MSRVVHETAILTVLAGSHVHGINTATSDYDYLSIRTAPHATSMGRQLRTLAPSFVSMQAVRRHLGYLDAQRGRMLGCGPHQSRKPNRPEIVAAHGFDTKFAAHALRLGWQGLELAETRRLTLPMNTAQQGALLRLRGGGMSQAEAIELIDEVRARLAGFVNGIEPSPAPANPDFNRINHWLVGSQLREAGLL